MSSTIRPLSALPFLPPRSLPQQGHDARGMKCVSSGVRPDFPGLPQPVLFLRFFFRPFVVGFGLPSLSHSGFFEVGWLTCLLMSLIFCPAFSLSISPCSLANCSLSPVICLSFSSSRMRVSSRCSRIIAMSLALGRIESPALSGPGCPLPFTAGAVTSLIRLHRHDRRQQGEPFRTG